MQNVLITGATGFIGTELAQLLHAAGIRPRVLVRRPHRAALLRGLDVEIVHGDLLIDKSLRRSVEGIDTVFHLGGRASFETYDRLKPSIVDATLRLGEVAVEAGVEHFVFASSLFVHDSQKHPIDASTTPRPALAYGRAKLEAEEGLAAIASASPMTVAALRLPHVYGPQSILFRQVRSGLAPFPGQMSNRCGHLHVRDAARVLDAVGRERWTGRSAVADSTIVRWGDFFATLAEWYPQFRLVRIPRWLGLAGAAVIEPLLSRRNRPTIYTKDTIVGFNLDVPVQPGLVWDDLAIEPDFPSVFEGIPAVLDGVVQYRWRHPLMDHRDR